MIGMIAKDKDKHRDKDKYKNTKTKTNKNKKILGRAVTGDKNKNTTGYSGHCDCDGDSDGGYVCGDYAPLNIAGCLGTQRALHQ